MAKDLSGFGWNKTIDEKSVTSVSGLVFYKDEDNEPCHALFADIGGVQQRFTARNVNDWWLSYGDPDPRLLRLRT